MPLTCRFVGAAEHLPDGFDATVVTVGCWDVPWGDLLAPGGRMVVPLRFSAITFVRDGDRWTGSDPTVCGFVPIQGGGGACGHGPGLPSPAEGRVWLKRHVQLEMAWL